MDLAYARILIKESLLHPGPGWLHYDKGFRQHLATLPWNELLYMPPTLLGKGLGVAYAALLVMKLITLLCTVPWLPCTSHHRRLLRDKVFSPRNRVFRGFVTHGTLASV